MKTSVIRALLAAAVLAVPAAHAATVTTWDVGTWTRFDLNSVLPIAGITKVNDQQLDWGTGGTSGITITQGGSSATPYVSANVVTNGAAVDNVIITHRNQPITGTTLTAVDILSTLYLDPVVPNLPSTPGIGPVTFKVSFAETPNGANPCANGEPNNQGVNINGCADIFVLDKNALNFSFFYDTDGAGGDDPVEYFLSFFEKSNALKSMDPAACSAAGASYPCLGFMTPEGLNTPAQFAVTITTQPVQVVPEPGTLALLGIALTGLGLARRRR